MPSDSLPADQLARESQAAIDRKDWAAADALLLQQLAAAPDDAGVLLNLGIVAFCRGAMPEAERYLNKAALRGVGERSWMLLAHIYAAARRDNEALRAYKAVLKENPGHFEALMALGDIRSRNGDRLGARENYRQAVAVRPDSADAAIKLAETLWEESPETAVAMTLAALPRAGDLQARARVLQSALWQVEFIERIRRGQMPYHGAHIDELFFTHAAPYLADFEATYAALAADPNNATAKIGLGLARFSRGDRHGAEALFQAAGPEATSGILGAACFSPDFHAHLRAMPDGALTAGLPPVITVRRLAPDSGGALYLSCDPGYAASFGLPLLCSLRAVSPGTPFHLHLIDASDAEVARFTAFCERLTPLRFALTVEQPGLAALSRRERRGYFHAVRLIRFHQAMTQYDGPLWMTDVDSIVHAPLSAMFSRLAGNDVALRIRVGRIEPQNQFSACAIGIAPTPRGRAYLRQVAAYIADFHQRNALRWGIDQLALYSVFADLRDAGVAPALGLLGNEDVVVDGHRSGVLWMTAGARKFDFLKQPAESAPPGEAAYASAFAAYRREAQAIAETLAWTI